MDWKRKREGVDVALWHFGINRWNVREDSVINGVDVFLSTGYDKGKKNVEKAVEYVGQLRE